MAKVGESKFSPLGYRNTLEPVERLHFMLALLAYDIGYVGGSAASADLLRTAGILRTLTLR